MSLKSGSQPLKSRCLPWALLSYTFCILLITACTTFHHQPSPMLPSPVGQPDDTSPSGSPPHCIDYVVLHFLPRKLINPAWSKKPSSKTSLLLPEDFPLIPNVILQGAYYLPTTFYGKLRKVSCDSCLLSLPPSPNSLRIAFSIWCKSPSSRHAAAYQQSLDNYQAHTGDLQLPPDTIGACLSAAIASKAAPQFQAFWETHHTQIIDAWSAPFSYTVGSPKLPRLYTQFPHLTAHLNNHMLPRRVQATLSSMIREWATQANDSTPLIKNFLMPIATHIVHCANAQVVKVQLDRWLPPELVTLVQSHLYEPLIHPTSPPPLHISQQLYDHLSPCLDEEAQTLLPSLVHWIQFPGASPSTGSLLLDKDESEEQVWRELLSSFKKNYEPFFNWYWQGFPPGKRGPLVTSSLAIFFLTSCVMLLYGYIFEDYPVIIGSSAGIVVSVSTFLLLCAAHWYKAKHARLQQEIVHHLTHSEV